MNIRCIIVDDSPLSIEILSDLLRDEHPSLTLVGSAQNGKDAIALIKNEQPDLVFLDVEMPDMNGFEVLTSLKEITFQTIFVTAFNQYAIQAIRFNALDYLVKPIDAQELTLAIQRFHSKRSIQHPDQIQNALFNLNKKDPQEHILFLPTQEGGIKMKLGDITRVEGFRNYSTFHLSNNKTKMSSKTLGYFEELLSGSAFFRCHRSFIVNRSHISKFMKDSFLMNNGEEIPISRRRKAEVKSWFYFNES